tara:strand:- start:21 stop:305 length:285 start_codon:yes stop_codon:yes gene_type:complete
MDFYKKVVFVFLVFVFFTVILVKILEPVLDRQISNIFKEKKLSIKLKKELKKSTQDFTPEKRKFYKETIKKLYKKWKPLIDESLKEANAELEKN